MEHTRPVTEGGKLKTKTSRSAIPETAKPKKKKGPEDHNAPDSSSPDRSFANNNEEIAVAGPCIEPEPHVDEVKTSEEDLRNKPNDDRVAVIINHLFDKRRKRKEAIIDGEMMQTCLKNLNFNTIIYIKDPVLEEIKKTIAEVSEMKALSCIVVVVMTHGEANGDLHAKDGIYSKSDLADPLLKSTALIGVPKLFFIQADDEKLQVDGEGGGESKKTKKVPTYADMLMMCSSVPASACDKGRGTPFIRSLCEQLTKAAEPTCEWDLLQMLVFVNKEIAELGGEMSKIKSTMTKPVKFSAA